MFGLNIWEKLEKKLRRHPEYTEGTIIAIRYVSKAEFAEWLIAHYGGVENVPAALRFHLEQQNECVVDIAYTTASGLQKELHCGGNLAEKLRELAVGDKVQIAYAEIDGVVHGKVIQK